MCLHNIDVNICRGRAVTNVGRTCGPTPLLEFIDAIKYVYIILKPTIYLPKWKKIIQLSPNMFQTGQMSGS